MFERSEKEGGISRLSLEAFPSRRIEKLEDGGVVFACMASTKADLEVSVGQWRQVIYIQSK